MTTDAAPTLDPLRQRFVLHWGEMGSRWGINRSMAQIQALLYLSPEPLSAEVIAETLGIARSNVSVSLRELQGWGVVRLVHQLGDRRDHFASLTDVWEMFRLVLEERKRREIDPTLEVLAACRAEAERAGDRFARERLHAMHDFFTTCTTWYGQVSRLPKGLLKRFLSLGAKIPGLGRGAKGGRDGEDK